MVIKPFRLTPEQKKTLLDLETDIRALDLEIKRAERAGIDVAELRKEYERSKKLREGILREYS